MVTPGQDIAHFSVWRLTGGERQHFPKHALLLRSIPRIFIYNFSFQYPRWEAISPEVCVPVLMIRTDCLLFTLKAAHSSRLLPTGSHLLLPLMTATSNNSPMRRIHSRKQNTMNCLSKDSLKQDLQRLPRSVMIGGILPFVSGFGKCHPMRLCKNGRRYSGK